MNGEILPSSVDGKENRLYRFPVGVIGVISPFNFPFFLSMRSVATALGAGNAEDRLKPNLDSFTIYTPPGILFLPAPKPALC